MNRNEGFSLQVLDNGRLCQRITVLQQRTRIQRCQLAAIALDIGLAELEQRADSQNAIDIVTPAAPEKGAEA